MKFSLLLLSIVNIQLMFGHPLFPNPDIEIDDTKWAWVPQVDGTFRLISIEDALREHDEIARTRINPDITYTLYTRSNPNEGQPIVIDSSNSLLKSNFNPKNPTRIITHGWQNDGTSLINTMILKALLQQGDYNVIIVDWGSIASSINYIYVRYEVPTVATDLAEFINFIHTTYEKKYALFENLVLIGHSLGAHVSGLAGKQLKDGKIEAIIGLDPAKPFFSLEKPEERLSEDDAKYVETIHTSAGVLGFRSPIGKVAFYPNWGTKQPGCGWDLAGDCAHGRSYEYYAETLKNDNPFIAEEKCRDIDDVLKKQCFPINDEVRMGGEPVNLKKPQGIFYLRTNSQEPFGVGKESI